MKTELSFDPTTETCRLETCERLGYKLKVVDIPGLDAETSSNPDIDRFWGLKNGIEMLAPGPNVLILVTPVDRYNEENNFLVGSLSCLEGISKYTIVIFTKVDTTKNPITREMISKSETLRDLLALSEGRFQLFNNVNKDEQQVQNLMKMVKTFTDSKQKKFFDNSIFTPDSVQKLSEVVVECEIKRKKAIETYMQF
ncbi:unnamed protein product [Mytilus coruscus]|uniref:AIG1-type G domain-containing protein n=1 Tax=Mytilus coruscus TaxID=42192 RepID=A0A6J8CNP7_MYTCO|nr:unnamed protein product [Mytilus coruscus]